VPQDSCLAVRIAAPATWQERFAKARVVEVLRAETLGPLVDRAAAAIDQGLADVRSSGRFDASLLEALLREYRGEIIASLQVDWDRLTDALERDGRPSVSLVIALAPDGVFDLAALASGLEKLIEDEPSGEPIRDLVVGAHRLRIGGKRDFQATLPAMIDGHLVMLGGTDLEQQAAHLLADKDRLEGIGGKAPLVVRARLDAPIKAALELVRSKLEGRLALPFDFPRMFRDLGAYSLQSLELTVDAQDELVAVDYELDLNGEERGLFGCLLFAQPQPELLRMLPGGADQFSIGAFDFGALWGVIEKLWRNLEDVVPMSFDQAMQEVTELLKVRLKEDLIDHLGTELMLLEDAQAALAETAENDTDEPTENMCIGVSLRNGKAFGDALETALRARGLHASRKSEEYAGTKILALTLAGLVDLEYAVADDLLLLSIGKGEASRRLLRGVLDARAAGADAALPAAAQARFERLPAGWSGISATNVPAMLRIAREAVASMDDAVEDLPDQVQMVFDVLDKVGGDLQRLGMQSMVSATYTTARKMTVRVRW
jgi:hypothetical protein